MLLSYGDIGYIHSIMDQSAGRSRDAMASSVRAGRLWVCFLSGFSLGTLVPMVHEWETIW